MKTMTKIEEIERELVDAGPDTLLTIRDYTDSTGRTRDLRVKLLDSEAYASMQEDDLQALAEADTAQYLSDGHDPGDLAATDILTARQQMIDALNKSLDKQSSTFRGAQYENVGGSVGRLPDKDKDVDAIYILRLLDLGEFTHPKPAKGAVPRAKQHIKWALNLKTNYYIHSVKLTLGKFTSVEVNHKQPLVSENSV